MKCAQAQKLIRPFLEHTLPDHELAQFLDHVQTCPDCYDELGIYLAIDQTIKNEDAKEDPDDFDFRNRLRSEIRESENLLRVHRSQAWIRRGLFLVAALLMGLLIYTGIMQSRHPDLPAWETEQEPSETVQEGPEESAAGEDVTEAATEENVSETASEEIQPEPAAEENLSETAEKESLSETTTEEKQPEPASEGKQQREKHE